jgi:hypothetical protein
MKEIDEKSEKEFLDSLDDPMNHKMMYIVLSQLRTNNTFQRPKPLIELLGKAFNKMINMANKSNIYDSVRNCIILSQTYFYEDESKTKRYLFEQIKSNKILNNSHFWRNFIDSMIIGEFERFKNNHSLPDYNIEKKDEIPPKIIEKLDEIVFSQLISFITNLVDFEMDKKLILRIADEFIKKYDYLIDSNKDSIYQIIAKSKDDIEKLRKEYDPSLENDSGINNDIDKKEKDENKDKENKKKEENAEIKENVENKEEEIKEEKKDENKDEQNNINNEKNE